jgi:hypothetical protein
MGKRKDLVQDRDETSKKIGQLIEERRNLHAEFKKQMDEFFAHRREQQARRDEQRRKEKEEYQKRKKLEAVQRARELAELPVCISFAF